MLGGDAYRYFSLSAILKVFQVDMFFPLLSHRIIISGLSLDDVDDSEGFEFGLPVLDAFCLFWDSSEDPEELASFSVGVGSAVLLLIPLACRRFDLPGRAVTPNATPVSSSHSSNGDSLTQGHHSKVDKTHYR